MKSTPEKANVERQQTTVTTSKAISLKYQIRWHNQYHMINWVQASLSHVQRTYHFCSSFSTHESFQLFVKSKSITTCTRRNKPDPNFDSTSAIINFKISKTQQTMAIRGISSATYKLAAAIRNSLTWEIRSKTRGKRI